MQRDSSAEQEAQKAYRRAVELANAGEFSAAIAGLSELIRLGPGHSNLFAHRGVIHARNHDVDAAIADFEEALRLDPANSAVYSWRAFVRRSRGDVERAIEDLTVAIRLQPREESHYKIRGELYLEQKKYGEAVEDFMEWISFSPTNPDAHRLRGIGYQNQGDYESAIADYSEAIRLNPGDAQAYAFRGAANFQINEYEHAIADLDVAIGMGEADADAFLWRACSHERLGNPDSALVDLNEAIRLAPGDARAFQRRGSLLLDSDLIDEAIADLTEAIRLSPENPSTYRRRSTAWLELDDVDRAEADLATAQELETRGENMTGNRNLVYSLLKDHFGATPLEALAITERRLPSRVRADLQLAISQLLDAMTVRHFCGVKTKYAHMAINLTSILVRDRDDPALAVAPQYQEIDVGDPDPVRCLKSGLWLLEKDTSRFAVFLEPESEYRRAHDVGFHIAVTNDAAGSAITKHFFQHLERAVREARSYRGKILSLEVEENYSGAVSGIKVHRLHGVEREQVILPRKTLDLLDRNVIEFVRRRPRLAEVGMATKKGLLFYGPPGTGKTHTIHYLASALHGMTTLLISAEQVGILGEYMTLARLLQPSMVVIEDADLIARERTSMNSACEEVLLNKLLNEMDGLKENADILFILTTNRPETLEAALAARPGRIDQAIEFPFPDDEGRAKLIRLYARTMPIADEVVHATVRKTERVSAAFIKELMRRATQFHIEHDHSPGLELEDIDSALDELLFQGGSLNRKLLGGQVDDAA